MLDKYSKVEEKLGEGLRRTEFIDQAILQLLLESVRLEEESNLKFEDMYSWEMTGVKTGRGGLRLNIVSIKAKNSILRFVFTRDKEKIQDFFYKNFQDNEGDKEVLSLRIG